MPENHPNDPATDRIKRMYGEDFYEISAEMRQARVEAFNRQYRQGPEFIDDLREADWRRKYDKAFGRRPS